MPPPRWGLCPCFPGPVPPEPLTTWKLSVVRNSKREKGDTSAVKHLLLTLKVPYSVLGLSGENKGPGHFLGSWCCFPTSWVLGVAFLLSARRCVKGMTVTSSFCVCRSALQPAQNLLLSFILFCCYGDFICFNCCTVLFLNDVSMSASVNSCWLGIYCAFNPSVSHFGGRRPVQ